MADSSVAVTPGAGASIDTFTTSTGEHRQVVVLGDPSTDAGVALISDTTTVTGALQRGPRELFAGDALNVNHNALNWATYKLTVKPTAGAMVASTVRYAASLHHAATSVRTIRIRQIEVTAAMSAVAQSLTCEVHRITAAPSVTNFPTLAVGTLGAAASHYGTDLRDSTSEAVAQYGNNATAPTVTSAGLMCSAFVCASNAAALHGGGVMVYNWTGGRFTKPITLRAGTLEGIAIGFVSSAAPTITPTVEITYTEE